MRNPLEERDSTMVTVQLFAVTFDYKIVLLIVIMMIMKMRLVRIFNDNNVNDEHERMTRRMMIKMKTTEGHHMMKSTYLHGATCVRMIMIMKRSRVSMMV